MCGRFEIHSALEIIADVFGIHEWDIEYTPNYNVAPSHDIVIAIESGKRKLVKSRWGFLPSWSKNPSDGFKMINARAETIAERPSFKQAFQKQRCLVLVDGFFEWQKTGNEKKPYLIRMKSGKPYALAGLYNIWKSPEGKELYTNTIITTTANELVRPLHDRMPVILPQEKYSVWLDQLNTDAASLIPLLKPYPPGEMEIFPVTSKMNSPRFTSQESILRIS